jgi:Ni,Fe-hydrogenase I small subunit
MSDWPFKVGDQITPLPDEHYLWPSVALAPMDTIVEDADKRRWWRRHARWEALDDGAEISSIALARRGPLTVEKCHEHYWCEMTSWSDRDSQLLCVTCGTEVSVPRGMTYRSTS